MQNQCQDNFSTTFTTYGEMQLYHEQLAKDSQWQRCKVSDLHVEPGPKIAAVQRYVRIRPGHQF